jgi:2,4-dienoyl-CoA reductase (NADPH2)
VVFEEGTQIGGQLAIAAAAPNRSGWRALLDYYRSALDRSRNIELRLGASASRDQLEGFDEVVIACGSSEILPAIPGIDRASSSTAAIAAGTESLSAGSNLLVVDDGFGWWLCASAVELGVAAGVRSVTVASPSASFAVSLPTESRVQLLQRLSGAPVVIRALTALESVGERYAELRNLLSGERERLAADAVVVVGERRARDWSSLAHVGATVRVIGDALVPRRVAHAIAEGRAAGEQVSAAEKLTRFGSDARSSSRHHFAL